MDRLAEILEQAGVVRWGICAFGDILPLIPCRAASRVPDGAKCVVTCLFPYYTGEKAARNVARYAVADDYHHIAGGILETAADALAGAYPGHAFLPFVDNSPIREVTAAVRSGLGVAGRNGLLIHPQYGSWLFVGTIITTAEFSLSRPKTGACQECGLCVDCCPTGALGKNGFQRELCRSHITQKKGALSLWEQRQIQAGGLIWGCDICQEVCPMNREVQISPIAAFYQHMVPTIHVDDLDPLMSRKAYGYRGRQVLLRNLQLLGGSAADLE